MPNQQNLEEQFSDLSGDFHSCLEFYQTIHILNELQNVSLLAYVHDSPHILSFLDRLKELYIHENCPHRSQDVAISAWKTFLQKLGGYVIVVIIGNSQKSISDALLQMSRCVPSNVIQII
jgi:hypothetical protein